MKIGIIIPTYNRPNDLERCLTSIEKQIRAPDEIIVVIGPDDAFSLKISQGYARKLKGMTILRSDKPSLIGSLNLALKKSLSEIIILTDDDSEAPPEWIHEIETEYIKNPTAGAIGGPDRIVMPQYPTLSNPIPQKKIGLFTWYGEAIGNHHCGHTLAFTKCDVLKGVNLSFRRTAFPIMKIDQNLISNGAEVGSEIDICKTISKAKWDILYVNKIYVRHYIGARSSGDHRLDACTTASLKRCYKLGYLTAKHFSVIYSIIFMVNNLLLGSKNQPGIIRLLLHILRASNPPLYLFYKSQTASLNGMRSGIMSNRRYAACNS